MPGLNKYDFHARQYDPLLGRFHTVDPMAEKYYSMSPYVYCMNNPLRFIDPTGMDIYRYDDKTGTFHKEIENDDDYDQVGQFKHDEKTDTYTLKTDKKGNVKKKIDNIEKGILSDGINFKEKNNRISVGGEGEPTLDGVRNFAMELDKISGVEISGYEIIEKGKKDVSRVFIAKYKDNTSDDSRTPVLPNMDSFSDGVTHFHTHPNSRGAMYYERIKASPGDFGTKARLLEGYSSMKFIILTKGVSPISY